MENWHYYLEVYEAFVKDGMTPEWAKLEVAGRALQDAQIGQFENLAFLLNDMRAWK
jgi:hypothetical protein